MVPTASFDSNGKTLVDYEVKDFIQSIVNSKVKMELINFLYHNPYTLDTAEGLSLWINIPVKILTKEINELVGAKIVAKQTVGNLTLYSYKPSIQLHHQVARFINYYSSMREIVFKEIDELEAAKKREEEKFKELTRSYQKLRTENRQLALLYKISQAVNSTIELDEMLNFIVNAVADEMNVARCSLVLIDERTKQPRLAAAKGLSEQLFEKIKSNPDGKVINTVLKDGKPLVVSSKNVPSGFVFASSRSYSTESFMCVPLRHQEKIIGVLNITDRLIDTEFDEDDLNLMVTIAAQLATAIENAKLYKQWLEKQRLERELEIAREIQQSFLPTETPDILNYSFSMFSQPAYWVGGDFYDFIKLKNNKIGIVIGDVAGKGMPASLYMVRVMTHFKSLAISTAHTKDVLNTLNHYFATERLGDLFVTLLYVILDYQQNRITFSSAGHNPLLLLKAAKNECLFYYPQAYPLGITDYVDYEEINLQLNYGDKIILFTDGIIEAKNIHGKEFGLDELKQIVWQSRDMSAGLTKEAIINKVMHFCEGTIQHDDLTLVVIKNEEPIHENKRI